MIVRYLYNIRYLYFVAFLFKYQAHGMYKIHCVLALSVLMQRMTATDLKLNQLLNRISRFYLIYSPMYQLCHSGTVLFFSYRSYCTHLSNAPISVLDFQSSVSPAHIKFTL